MTLQQLTYFLAAAEHGSFSAAAESLHHGPAEPLRADPPARGGARRAAVRARRPRARADRGGAAAAPARRAHARRRARGRRVGARGARPHAAARSRSARSAAPTTTCSAAWSQDFRTRHPNVRVRAVGQNSAEVADAVRDGQLEAGLVALPIDDRGLDVRPAMREELLYVTRRAERAREPMTIERLADAPLILYDARWGADDPTRRQLRERAQHAGVKVEPQIEVEYMTAALELARARARRHVAVALDHRARAGCAPQALDGVPFDPPLYDTFAFITRRNAHLSPATREFIAARREARRDEARSARRRGRGLVAARGRAAAAQAAQERVDGRGAMPLSPSRRTTAGSRRAAVALDARARSRAPARSAVGGRSPPLVPGRHAVLLVVVQRGGDLAREDGRDATRRSRSARGAAPRRSRAGPPSSRRSPPPTGTRAARRRRRRSRCGRCARSIRWPSAASTV